MIDATPDQEVFFATDDAEIFTFEQGDSDGGSSQDVIRGFGPEDQIDLTDFGFTGTRLPSDPADDDLVVVREISSGVVLTASGDKQLGLFIRERRRRGGGRQPDPVTQLRTSG